MTVDYLVPLRDGDLSTRVHELRRTNTTAQAEEEEEEEGDGECGGFEDSRTL